MTRGQTEVEAPTVEELVRAALVAMVTDTESEASKPVRKVLLAACEAAKDTWTPDTINLWSIDSVCVTEARLGVSKD